MKVTHRIDLECDRPSIKAVKEAIQEHNIPDNASIYESGDEYSLVIEWSD